MVCWGGVVERERNESNAAAAAWGRGGGVLDYDICMVDCSGKIGVRDLKEGLMGPEVLGDGRN